MKKSFYIIALLASILLVSYKSTDTIWQAIDLKTAAKELKDLQISYSKITNYSVKINYHTYDTKSNDDIHDKSNGYMIKSGIYSKSRLLGIYSVQNEKLRVTIDSSRKTIQVSNTFTIKDPGFSLKDYLKILSFCKTVKKVTENNLVGYRFETKNTEGLIAQELFIENGITKEVNAYYANEHFFRTNNDLKKEIVYPRLQVLFTDFNPKIKMASSEFSYDNIIHLSNENKIKLTSNYTGYKLIDGRIKK
jgi:hypothetical protein